MGKSKPKPAKSYGGYLQPHEATIRKLYSEGKTPMQIGHILYAQGVRSPHDKGPDENGYRIDHPRTFCGLVRYMLGLNDKATAARKKRKKVKRPTLTERLATRREQIKNAGAMVPICRRSQSPSDAGRSKNY
jgi:hypothetical protein